LRDLKEECVCVCVCACGNTGMFIERLECFWKRVVYVCVEGEIRDVVGEMVLLDVSACACGKGAYGC